MTVVRMWAIVLCIYVSGLSFYSSLFIFSDNQFLLFQIGKVIIASFHCLVIFYHLRFLTRPKLTNLRMVMHV